MKNLKKTNKTKKAPTLKNKTKAKRRYNIYVKFLYLIVAIGYIGSLATMIILKEPLQEYNTKAIQYVSLANQGLKTYGTIQEINSVVQDQISTAYENPEAMIKGNVNKVTDSLFDSKLFSEKESKRKSSTSQALPNLDYLLQQLVSNKILHTILLALSFPAFSPILLIALIFTILSERHRILVLSPRASNHLIMLPSVYVTNLILAIISIATFYHFTYLGLALAIVTHLIFICQTFNGLRLKFKGFCIACGQDIKA